MQLRFMVTAANRQASAQLSTNTLASSQPGEIFDPVAFERLQHAKVPPTFTQLHCAERVPLTRNYRRSYMQFNPVVNTFERLITNKIRRQKQTKEDAALAAAMTSTRANAA